MASVCPRTEAAPGDETSRAAQLKREGNDAMLRMQYVDALAKYQEANRLAPDDPSILYNLGRAYQLVGAFPQALDALERFAALSPEMRAKVPNFDALFADVRSRVATVTVACHPAPSRALVLLNDKVIAQRCSGDSIRVVAGSARVRVEAEGYVAAAQNVTLKGGSASSLDFELFSASTAGTIQIRSEPQAARIDVDGKPRGSSPLDVTAPSGQHSVRARLDGYEDATIVVDVAAGKRTEAPLLRLDRTPSILTRWWFWGGAALVVAGGTALTIALLTERSAPVGTASPGQVSAPLLKF
jgi:hypothetical protein